MRNLRTILILEPHLLGHHGPWLEWISRGLADNGYSVLVQTFKTVCPHPILTQLSDAGIRLIEMAPRVPSMALPSDNRVYQLIRREFAYWKLFNEWYNYAQELVTDIGLVFAPYLDYCLYSIGLRGSPFGDTPWAGLAMRPSFHYAKMGVAAPPPNLRIIKQLLFFRMLADRRLRAFFTIDEPLAGYLQTTLRGKARVNVHFLPEPADFSSLPTQSEARMRLGLPQDRKLILGYGSLAQRKGIVELLMALANKEFPSNTNVFLAGESLPDIKPFLASEVVHELMAQGRLRLFDKFISVEDEALYFAASDIVWLGYKSFYSASGVLIQAAKTARPVVACREGVIGWQVRRHQCGLLVDPGSLSQVLDAIKTLTADSVFSVQCGNNGFRAFAANTKSKAVECLVEAFE